LHVERLKRTRRQKYSPVLFYGGNAGFDFGATELIEYKAGVFHGR
jgi:hypothetical protein